MASTMVRLPQRTPFVASVRWLSMSRIRGSKGDKRGVVMKSSDDAIADVHDGARVLIGGFGLCGVPENLIRALMRTSVRNLRVVSNTAGTDEHGIGPLINDKRVKAITASYIGENKELQRQYRTGEIEVDFVPQGTLAERCRAGGMGVPAFYTATGHGTLVEFGGIPFKMNEDGSTALSSLPKELRSFHGTNYLMEEWIKGDFSLIKGWKADKLGNVVFHQSARNFNQPMARAGSITIVEVEEIVEVGELEPGFIHLPSIYVNRIVMGEEYIKPIERLKFRDEVSESDDPAKEQRRIRIAKRAAQEFHDGAYVNLGMGIPVLAADYVSDDVEVHLQCENGLMGLGPHPLRGEENPDLINAAKETVTMRKGASFFGSDEAFGQIRGGHLDLTMLGSMQVSAYGDMANWMIPGRITKGMGGAMDLVSAPDTRVIVTMEHCAKNGACKIVQECDMPLTGVRVVDRIITDKAVFDVDNEKGLTLIETAEGESPDTIRNVTKAPFRIAREMKHFS